MNAYSIQHVECSLRQPSFRQHQVKEYKLKNVVLVTGNGLSIDLRSKFPDLLDTSYPLSVTSLPDYYVWNGFITDFDLVRHFPMLSIIIDNARRNFPKITDFEILEKIRSEDHFSSLFATSSIFERDDYRLRKGLRPLTWEQENKKGIALAHLRLYLIHVFSYYDRCIFNEYLNSWRWTAWMQSNHNKLLQVISFNYDILIERAYKEPTQDDYLLHPKDINATLDRLVFSKPHGSVNHSEPQGIDFGELHWNYPSPNRIVEYGSGNVNIIPRNRMNQLRPFSDIVLPTEAVGMRQELRHIKAGYQRIKKIAPRIELCIIAGISYWHCDRPEINEIIESLPAAKILVCNPYPPLDLLKYLVRNDRKFEVIKEDLPVV